MIEESHANSTTETIDEDEINLLELLRVVVRRRMLIIKVCFVAIVLSVCYTLTLKNIYTATTSVLPPPREPNVGLSAVVGSAIGGAAALAAGQNTYLELYVSIFKSRTVLDAVVKRLDLQTVFKAKTMEAARNRLKGSANYQAGKDGIITVSVSNKDPQLAALLANTLVEEVTRRSGQLYLTKVTGERNFLEKRLKFVREELKAAEENLKVFQVKHKALRVDSQASVAIEGFARVRAEIVSKEIQLAVLRESRTDESSDVKEIQTAIARLKGQLTAMSGSGGVDSIIPATGNVPALGLEFARLLREVKIQEAIFDQLTKQNEMAKINEVKESGVIQVLDDAIVPTRKSKPNRKLIVLVATCLAFVGSVAYVLIQHYFSKLSPEDAEIITEIKQSLLFRKRDP